MMKKLMKSLLLLFGVFCMVFFADMQVHAETANAKEDFGYVPYDDDGVLIEVYMGTSNKVIIPEEIDGKKVYAVTNEAFRGKSNIEEIYLPDMVEALDWMAFGGCTNLRRIYLGSLKKPLQPSHGYAGLLANCPNLKYIGMSNQADFDLSADRGSFEVISSDTLGSLKNIYIGSSMTRVDRSLSELYL